MTTQTAINDLMQTAYRQLTGDKTARVRGLVLRERNMRFGSKTMLGKLSASRLKAIAEKAAKPKRQTPEFDQQVTFFAILDANTAKYPFLRFIHASMNGAYMTKATAGKAKASGMRKGVFDICVPFARRSYGCAWIEMKAGRNGLTEEQQYFRAQARFEGHATAICYSADEAIEFVEWYLGIELVK